MDARFRWLWPLCALLLASFAGAQDDPKFSLKARFEPATAAPGATVKLVLEAETAVGWHAYGTSETTNIPVSLDAAAIDAGGLKVAGQPQIPSGMPTPTPVGTSFPLPEHFEVTLSFEVPSDASGEVEVSGVLGYQICDEAMCERPNEAPFSTTLKIGQGGAGGAGKEPQGRPQGVPELGLAPGLRLESDEKLTVRARFEPAEVRAGELATLVLECTTIDGWHAYGTMEGTNVPVGFDQLKQDIGALEFDGEPQIPPGDPHDTPIGTSYPLPQVFVVRQVVRVPAGTEPGDVSVAGVLDYQVCDEGSCDVPTEAEFGATLKVVAGEAREDRTGAAAAAAPTPAAAGQDPDESHVRVAARFEPEVARAGEVATLVLAVQVDEGWHVYGTREGTNIPVAFDPAKQDAGELQFEGDAQVPPGEAHETPIGPSYPLPLEFEVRQPLRVPAGTEAGEVPIEGVLDYQVCNDEGFCLRPMQAAYDATLRIEAGEARGEFLQAAATDDGASADGDDDGGWWGLILLCIGGGLFALAMPCTYPMIPITFSFFMKQAEKREGNVLPLAIIYGLGIVAMFVAVGVGLSQVIIPFVNHWMTNAVIGLFFFFFAFVLFGWVNLNPPQWMNRLAQSAQSSAMKGGQQQESGGGITGGALLGVFFMGATLVITSFTCTAPIVGTLIAQAAVYGTTKVAVGMAIFGLTMALPFMALSMMPGKVKALPKSGSWMDTLKISLGFVELAAAFKFVSMVDFAFGWQILPRELFLMLWAAIFGLWALFLFGILRKQGTPNEGVSNARMAGGMLVTMLAAYFLFGAIGNRLDPLMTGFVPGYSNSLVQRGGGGSHDALKHEIVYDDPDRAIALAKKEGKLLLYNFTGFN